VCGEPTRVCRTKSLNIFASKTCSDKCFRILQSEQSGWRSLTPQDRARATSARRELYESGSDKALAAKAGMASSGITREAVQATGRGAMGPLNARAKAYRITSPDGDVYEVIGIANFVRTHEHLFAPAKIEWTASEVLAGSGRPRARPAVQGVKQCRATKGLYGTVASSARTWFGWKAERIGE